MRKKPLKRTRRIAALRNLKPHENRAHARETQKIEVTILRVRDSFQQWRALQRAKIREKTKNPKARIPANVMAESRAYHIADELANHFMRRFPQKWKTIRTYLYRWISAEPKEKRQWKKIISGILGEKTAIDTLEMAEELHADLRGLAAPEPIKIKKAKRKMIKKLREVQKLPKRKQPLNPVDFYRDITKYLQKEIPHQVVQQTPYRNAQELVDNPFFKIALINLAYNTQETYLRMQNELRKRTKEIPVSPEKMYAMRRQVVSFMVSRISWPELGDMFRGRKRSKKKEQVVDWYIRQYLWNEHQAYQYPPNSAERRKENREKKETYTAFRKSLRKLLGGNRELASFFAGFFVYVGKRLEACLA